MPNFTYCEAVLLLKDFDVTHTLQPDGFRLAVRLHFLKDLDKIPQELIQLPTLYSHRDNTLTWVDIAVGDLTKSRVEARIRELVEKSNEQDDHSALLSSGVTIGGDE